MRTIKALQLLIYVAFFMLIIQKIVPGFIQGFKDGYNDGFNQAHGLKQTGPKVPVLIRGDYLLHTTDGKLKVDSNYTLQDILIDANMTTGDKTTPSFGMLDILKLILVFGIIVTLALTAWTINKAIISIAKGEVFTAYGVRIVRRIGQLLLIYIIADVIYQRINYQQVKALIHEPLHLINPVEFNYQLLIGAILAYILAEAFKQGKRLKEEQEYTI